MFGLFGRKTEVQKLIDQVGIEQASMHYAKIVSRKLPNAKISHQFMLEELDAASKGNAVAREFANNSSIPEHEFRGAMDRSFPEVDGPNGPQQELTRITMQLQKNPTLMVQFRLLILQQLLRNIRIGKPGEPTAPTAPKGPEDIARLLEQHGVQKATEIIKSAAIGGNLPSQIFLSNTLMQVLERNNTEQTRKAFEEITKLAAAQGDADSQFNLGVFYTRQIDTSDGFLSDTDRATLEQALYWHEKAAAQGVKLAAQASTNIRGVLS